MNKTTESEYEAVEIEVEEKVKGPKKIIEEERGFGKKALGFMSFGAWGKADRREIEEVKTRKVKKQVMQKKKKLKETTHAHGKKENFM